jgi:hypothetical protein
LPPEIKTSHLPHPPQLRRWHCQPPPARLTIEQAYADAGSRTPLAPISASEKAELALWFKTKFMPLFSYQELYAGVNDKARISLLPHIEREEQLAHAVHRSSVMSNMSGVCGN